MYKITGGRQEIFERVGQHLVRQGKRSFDANKNGCMYRGPDNTSCAVGCLIPDSEYDPKFEGRTLTNLIENKLLSADVELVSLLAHLQNVHDIGPLAFDNWFAGLKYRLYGTADHFDLEFSDEMFESWKAQ
jgi:hypothetical protein